jgi:hypothetical protein
MPACGIIKLTTHEVRCLKNAGTSSIWFVTMLWDALYGEDTVLARQLEEIYDGAICIEALSR